MHFLLSKKVNMRFPAFLADFGRFSFQKKIKKITDFLAPSTFTCPWRNFSLKANA